MEETIKYITEAEYLEYEIKSEQKSEYFDGQIINMAGASEIHNTISCNVVSELRFQLKKKACQVYASDMRIKVENTGFYAYPDILVVCPEKKFTGDKPDTILNPIVIIEILSESTESYDRGAKFAHYRQVPSLKEYILISQKEKKIEKYQLNSAMKWELEETTKDKQLIELSSISCYLELQEVYDKIEEL